MKEVVCPSGAVLKLSAAPFADSRELYKAILSEGKSVQVSEAVDILQIGKDVFCTSFSSPVVETALWKCLQRCIYNDGRGDLKIDLNSFEPENSREDYMFVCTEVIKENISPFLKNLSAQFKVLFGLTGMNLK